MEFEEINKERAIEIILWNKARGTALPGIFDKGHAKDGEVNGRNCLIH
jgi:alpha-D-ribose 1-methylphosphonate 5-triphosphate synthase subunit PhnL